MASCLTSRARLLPKSHASQSCATDHPQSAENNTRSGVAHLREIANLQVPGLSGVRNLIRPPVGKLIFEALDLAGRNSFVQQRIIEPSGAARLHAAASDAQIWCDED